MLATKIDTEARALRALWTIPQIVERRPWWDGERWEVRLEFVLLDSDATTMDDINARLKEAGWDVAWDSQQSRDSRFWECEAYYPSSPWNDV